MHIFFSNNSGYISLRVNGIGMKNEGCTLEFSCQCLPQLVSGVAIDSLTAMEMP